MSVFARFCLSLKRKSSRASFFVCLPSRRAHLLTTKGGSSANAGRIASTASEYTLAGIRLASIVL